MQSSDRSSTSHPVTSTSSATFSASQSPDESSPRNPTTSTDRQGSNECGTASDTCTESAEYEVLLSVYWKNGLIGASSHNVGSPKVNVLDDIPDDGKLGFPALEMIFLHVQPTHVVTSESMPENFLEKLNKLTRGNGTPGSVGIVRLHTLPSAEFRNDNCKRRIHALRLRSKPTEWSDENHISYLKATLNFHAHAQIQSLGGLLKFMDKNLCSLGISSVDQSITGFRKMTLENFVWVDQETYRALGIFPEKETFSKWTKWAQKDNKGAGSVFGMFNRCRTNMGSQFMRSVFLKPSKDLAVIAERQEAIAFFMDMRHEEYVNNLLSSINQVKGVATLQNILLVGEICGHLEQNVKFFSKIRNTVTADLGTVTRIIARTVDFDAPDGQEKFVVMPGVDPNLDHKKKVYAELPVVLNKVAEVEIENLPECISSCLVTYYPEIGFLLAVTEWKEGLTEHEKRLSGYQYKFTSNGFIHYKSRHCCQLDKALGDPIVDISEIQLCLMMRLVEYVQQHVDTILEAVNLIAELDCLISFAMVAREHNYVKPKMTKEHKIDIVQGRYLLEESIASSFVPNDVESSSQSTLVKIITGANNSGKTVYLKQATLIVFLAHLGSFVPAQKATIEVMDRICTCIPVRGTALDETSTYLSDIRQMSTAVDYPDHAALVVIDEFGKSTEDSNGRALLAACLNHFLRRGAAGCPHVMVATHYTTLHKLLIASHLLREQKMDQMLSAEGEVTNLYRLVDGQAKSSLALQAARLAELPQSIINRAEELMSGSAAAQLVDTARQRERRDAIFQAFLECPLETDDQLRDLIKYFQESKLM